MTLRGTEGGAAVGVGFVFVVVAAAAVAVAVVVQDVVVAAAEEGDAYPLLRQDAGLQSQRPCQAVLD